MCETLHLTPIASSLARIPPQRFKSNEQVLLTGQIHGVVQQYQEITRTSSKFSLHCLECTASSLALILLMFFKGCPQRSVVSFDHVETVAGLLLVLDSERSFCGLQKLKTWLRSTMPQTRPNSVAMCRIHKDGRHKQKKRC